jgi:hypothetical protein
MKTSHASQPQNDIDYFLTGLRKDHAEAVALGAFLRTKPRDTIPRLLRRLCPLSRTAALLANGIKGICAHHMGHRL